MQDNGRIAGGIFIPYGHDDQGWMGIWTTAFNVPGKGEASVAALAAVGLDYRFLVLYDR